ncbi:EthD domain-containing protein [Thermaurantiacus tibetensis]|uniref:EthD domain-containing protein n=1 Tax=Thermaurantiacus tibetensis TaxID=2759035 RepID=UPI00188FF5A7|nr:EthD domain-containing protein [Thermaurantiacus tibetensis]
MADGADPQEPGPITLVTLLKRRPGMSWDDFVAYYETHHRRIGEDVLAGFASRYERRYLRPAPGGSEAADVDVLLEIDFPSAAHLAAFRAAASVPEVRARIVADEERLFDRRLIRSFTVTAARSPLPPPADLLAEPAAGATPRSPAGSGSG